MLDDDQDVIYVIFDTDSGNSTEDDRFGNAADMHLRLAELQAEDEERDGYPHHDFRKEI